MNWLKVAVVVGLVGLVVSLNGCDDPFGEKRLKLEEEARRHAEALGSLKAQNRTLVQERKQLEIEVKSLTKENEKLKEQATAKSALASQLKEEVERLKAAGVAAVAAEAVEEAATMSNVDAHRQGREKRMAEITKAISTLEPRITNLRVEIARGKAKVSALIRASIDVRMIPPPGGYIKDGQVWRRGKRYNVGTAKDPWWRYRPDVPIGPAVKKGDFRTAHERSMAVEAAKTKLLPLFEELRPLEKELAQLKKELGKLRKEKIDEMARERAEEAKKADAEATQTPAEADDPGEAAKDF